MVDDDLFKCAVTLAAGLLSSRGSRVEDDEIENCVKYCYEVLGEAYEDIDAEQRD